MTFSTRQLLLVKDNANNTLYDNEFMSVVLERGDDDGFGRPWEWMVWKKPQGIQDDDDDLGTNEAEPLKGEGFLEKGLRLASTSNRSFFRDWLKLVKKWDNPLRVNEKVILLICIFKELLSYYKKFL